MVLLAAFRLPWPPGVRVYELDLPDVLAFKERVLAERSAVAGCQRTTIAVDLREDWPTPLRRAGLATTEATAWLAEGLLIYLSESDAATLLDRVSASSAAGSQMAFEVGGLGTDRMRAQAGQLPAMRPYAQLWKGGLPDAPGWLAEHGWHPQLHDRAAVAADHGRSQTDPSPGGFVIATHT